MIDAPRDRANDPARRATPDSQVIFRKGNEADDRELLNRAVGAADTEGYRSLDRLNAERILQGGRAENHFAMTVGDAHRAKATGNPIHGDADAIARHEVLDGESESPHELLQRIGTGRNDITNATQDSEMADEEANNARGRLQNAHDEAARNESTLYDEVAQTKRNRSRTNPPR